MARINPRVCTVQHNFNCVTKRDGHIVIRRCLIYPNGACYDLTNEFRIKRVVMDWNATIRMKRFRMPWITYYKMMSQFEWNEEYAVVWNKRYNCWRLLSYVE